MGYTNFYVNELKQFVDGKIISTINTWTENPDDNVFFGLQIELPSGKIKNLWLLKDDGGSGPGSFTIEDVETE